MNSRSQTKIRKIQQTNLLAEERYLKAKRLLKENPEGGIETCLTTAEIEIPSECSSTYTPEDGGVSGFGACVTKLIDLYATDSTNLEKVCKCISDNTPVDVDIMTKTLMKTACQGIGGMMKTGTDILKKGTDILSGGGIKF